LLIKLIFSNSNFIIYLLYKIMRTLPSFKVSEISFFDSALKRTKIKYTNFIIFKLLFFN
jgi:hypothetical protein